MIRAEHLEKAFKGKKVVSDVSFRVSHDETMVLLGTSGSGKTTTLKLINGLIKPDQGKVWINGKDTSLIPVAGLRRQIGFVLQNLGLFPHYTVEENIAAVPQLLGWEKKKINVRVRQLLEKLHLPYEEFGRAYPHQLSGGQQQRVGLARALAANPPILLMDEPFSALDPITRQRIRKEFRELDELQQKAIILVTHDVQEAFEMGNQICLMDGGIIVQSGSPTEILLRRQESFVSQFLRDQQLVLELKAVPIARYWDLLTNNQPTQPTNFTYHATSTLFDILQDLMDNPDSSASVVVLHENGQKKATTFQGLMQAFMHYKKQYR